MSRWAFLSWTSTKLQVLGSQVPFRKKVGKEYRGKSLKKKIMSDKAVIWGVKQ